MVKVRVIKGLSIASALASGLAACANPTEEVASDDSALTVADPGTGTLTLGWASGSPTGYGFAAKNSTDEYVRSLETMTFQLPAQFLWAQLRPGQAVPQDIERLKQISATVKVTYVKDGAAYASTSLEANSFDGTVPANLRAITPSFKVDKRAQGMRFSVELTDNGASPPVKKLLGEDKFPEQTVIGGSLPGKTLLFDHLDRKLRSRVLEGGLPVADAELLLAYTDWRAASVVDATSIDRTIGTSATHGRFGPFEMPIYGDVKYEVTYAVAVDGVWQAEQKLVTNDKSRLLPAGRTSYEGVLDIPGGAKGLQVYFHVKAFLEVDYSRHGSDIRWKKYNDGDRILMKDKFDNENGTQSDNYDFEVETR